MKHLTLIRHAKSAWGDYRTPDHDRPLNRRGEKAAPRIGRALAERDCHPDAIISSSAVRARATAAAIAGQLDFPESEIAEEPRIYAAAVPALFEVVRGLDEALDNVFLVGHNPGFQDFANARLRTCAVLRLNLAIDRWAEAGEGCARLVEHLYPKMIV
jgi:phosphohistidine phosphatase